MTAGARGTVVTMPLRDQLRAALTGALKARDRQAASVLRSALAAIDNAESVQTSGRGAGAIEQSPLGLAAAEVARRELTENDIIAIVQAEIADREDAARGYESAGAVEPAVRLRQEAAYLMTVLASPDSSSCGT